MSAAPARTARQEELVDLALELAREVGLAGLTVRKLAERAGFTEAALYRHFHDKQALLLAMVERLSEERLLTPLRAIAADPERTPRERLAAVVRHHVSTILALEGLPVLVLAEAAAAGDEALLARYRVIAGELRQILGGLLTAAGLDEEGPSAAALGVVLIGIGAATALQLRLGISRALEREVRDELPRFVVERLLGPEPGARSIPEPAATREPEATTSRTAEPPAARAPAARVPEPQSPEPMPEPRSPEPATTPEPQRRRLTTRRN